MMGSKELWSNILFSLDGKTYLTKYLKEDTHGNEVTVTMEAIQVNKKRTKT